MNTSESLSVVVACEDFGGKLCWSARINNKHTSKTSSTLGKAVSLVSEYNYHIERVELLVPFYKISAEEELDLIRYKCK